MHIVYASDENYLRFLEVAIGSAFLCSSDIQRIVVDVLSLDIADDVWQSWHSRVVAHLPVGATVNRHVVDASRFDGLWKWHGSKAAYARLLLPEILGGEEWCVYADVDTLFTDDPLKLNEVYCNHYSIMGHLEWPMKNNDETRVWCEKCGFPFDLNRYFCSGFVLINLEWFRRNDATRKCLDLLREHPEAPLVDQAALNVVCFDTCGSLPDEWGTFGGVAFEGRRPALIHYPGCLPWKFTEELYPDYIDAYNIWFRYAKRVYGKGWKELIVSRASWACYFRMRILGALASVLRCAFADIPMIRGMYVMKYLRKKYATHDVWLEINECINRKGWINEKR